MLTTYFTYFFEARNWNLPENNIKKIDREACKFLSPKETATEAKTPLYHLLHRSRDYPLKLRTSILMTTLLVCPWGTIKVWRSQPFLGTWVRVWDRFCIFFLSLFLGYLWSSLSLSIPCDQRTPDWHSELYWCILKIPIITKNFANIICDFLSFFLQVIERESPQ